MANKVYYRLYDYYRYRQINFVIILFMAIFISFLPEALVFLFNFFARADARRELRFLKKLIIVNGSIKPVDFMELLDILKTGPDIIRECCRKYRMPTKETTLTTRLFTRHISAVPRILIQSFL
jgi:hypothetical protein